MLCTPGECRRGGVLICGNVINQEVLRQVCCTEDIPVGASGTGELSLMHRNRGCKAQHLCLCFCCSLKNKDCILLPLNEVALNCMRLCRSKMLPDLAVTCLGFLNFRFFLFLQVYKISPKFAFLVTSGPFVYTAIAVINVLVNSSLLRGEAPIILSLHPAFTVPDNRFQVQTGEFLLTQRGKGGSC